MSAVTIYTRPWCGYCRRAVRQLERLEVSFEEIDLDAQPQREAEMIRRSKRLTVPQIFVGEVHVGGSHELAELERQGKLSELLQSQREETGGA